MQQVTKRLNITGRVQGVGFRFYMERKARELGLSGWVRNRRDGGVEAVVQGSAAAVESMIAWARRGPPSAVVAEVRVADASGDYAGFETRPTE
jgi:acylphosphatase